MAETSSPFPFRIAETDRPDAEVTRLFQRCFGGMPPPDGRHFVALRDGMPRVAAYIHYYRHEEGVYLCGGLCVDTRIYRDLSAGERAIVASAGSLSRHVILKSVEALGPKRAVFAFTGNVRSRRDALALDFVPAAGRHLLVQWHDEDAATRNDLVARIERLGPF